MWEKKEFFSLESKTYSFHIFYCKRLKFNLSFFGDSCNQPKIEIVRWFLWKKPLLCLKIVWSTQKSTFSKRIGEFLCAKMTQISHKLKMILFIWDFLLVCTFFWGGFLILRIIVINSWKTLSNQLKHVILWDFFGTSVNNKIANFIQKNSFKWMKNPFLIQIFFKIVNFKLHIRRGDKPKLKLSSAPID